MKSDPAALIRLLNAVGITIRLKDEETLLVRGVLTQDVRTAIVSMKPQLLAYLRDDHARN